jgi:HJR/Mrr/RecB family endonuclease
LSLEHALEEKEQKLKEIRSVKFKLWFVGRLTWTYIKSVLGFFIPNTLVLVVAGSLIGLIAPNNVPGKWITTWLPAGWVFLLIFGGAVLFALHETFKVSLFQWLCSAIIFGIFCSIPYLLIASDDPTFLYYGYVAFTFAGTPFIFIFRRVYILWMDTKSLPLMICSLKKQIEEREKEKRMQEEQLRKTMEQEMEKERIRKEKLRKMWAQKIEKRKKFEENMRSKGLIPFVNKQGKEKWGTPLQVEEWKRIDIGLHNRFADYSPREFEKLVAKLFTAMGYEVRLGPYVGDYGADIIACKDNRRVLIQCKKYARGHLVGNREVRDALGAVWSKADKAILVTTSDFTEQAYEQAKGAPIELWNYWTLKKYMERYLVDANTEGESIKESIAVVEEENETNFYREAYPELSEEEAELQETQEVDMDFEDEEDCAHQADCKHLNVMQIPVFNVRGEPRRVVKKCADCGKILETQNIGR